MDKLHGAIMQGERLIWGVLIRVAYGVGQTCFSACPQELFKTQWVQLQ